MTLRYAIYSANFFFGVDQPAYLPISLFILCSIPVIYIYLSNHQEKRKRKHKSNNLIRREHEVMIEQVQQSSWMDRYRPNYIPMIFLSFLLHFPALINDNLYDLPPPAFADLAVATKESRKWFYLITIRGVFLFLCSVLLLRYGGKSVRTRRTTYKLQGRVIQPNADVVEPIVLYFPQKAASIN